MAPNAAAGVIADLRAESDDLDRLVAELPAAGWATATPAEGWTIAHQIAHLWWTDQVSVLAVTDEDAFRLKQGRSVVLVPRQVEAVKAGLKPGSRTVSAMSGGSASAATVSVASRVANWAARAGSPITSHRPEPAPAVSSASANGTAGHASR